MEEQELHFEDEFCPERTESQWIAYKFFTAQSSILSILGSSLIIFMALRRGRDAFTKFQNRLLLPMSVFDIIGSLGWAFSTTPIPRGSNCTYGALGNKATCVAQGFMITLGFSVPMYNAMLCIYYLLVVKYNVRDEVIAKYEPLMHIVSICPALIGAIVAAANDLFNNYIFICWVVDDKFVDIENTNDHKSDYVLFGLYTVIMITVVLILLTIGHCMINIYRFVKDQEVKMNSHRFQRPPDNNRSPGNTSSQSSRLSNAVIDTKKQAFLYVGSFILTYVFSIICVVIELLECESPYALMLLQGIFAPLQGFLNFLAYIRPRFNIISRQHNEKGIFRRLYITVFHKPEPSIPPRGGRRKRQKAGGSALRSNRTKNNDGAAKKSINDGTAAKRRSENDAVTASKQHAIKNYQPLPPHPALNHLKEPYQTQQPDSKMQHSHFAPPENPQKDNHGVYDDEEQLERYDDDSTTLDDNPEAVTLSFLVAEDILPRSLHRNSKERKRRASMMDSFTVQADDDKLSGQQYLSTILEGREKELFATNASNLSMKHHQTRRHSCPVINNITELENITIDGENHL